VFRRSCQVVTDRSAIRSHQDFACRSIWSHAVDMRLNFGTFQKIIVSNKRDATIRHDTSIRICCDVISDRLDRSVS
jgi:hypothetical protein